MAPRLAAVEARHRPLRGVSRAGTARYPIVPNLTIDDAKRMLIRFTKSYYLAVSTLFDLALSAKNRLSQPVSAYDS